MDVIKASGEKERFKPEKIRRTLIRAGASRILADEIISKIESQLREGTTTREILHLALKLLRKKDPIVEARYDLKRAIMDLGPTGFPFEKYFAELLRHHGYKVGVGKIVKGKLISHEVDIVAKKDKSYMIECKYHNQLGVYTNIKVALYVYARFLDLKDKFNQAWLATNTKFSRSAILYAEGIGLRLTSWEYPKDASLQKLIESKSLYPITVLKSVDNHVKEKLSRANIMLAIHLTDTNIKELRKKTGLPEHILMKVVEEAKGICYKPHPENVNRKGLHLRH